MRQLATSLHSPHADHRWPGPLQGRWAWPTRPARVHTCDGISAGVVGQLPARDCSQWRQAAASLPHAVAHASHAMLHLPLASTAGCHWLPRRRLTRRGAPWLPDGSDGGGRRQAHGRQRHRRRPHGLCARGGCGCCGAGVGGSQHRLPAAWPAGHRACATCCQTACSAPSSRTLGGWVGCLAWPGLHVCLSVCCYAATS